jgi:hypothetical protein
MTTTRHNSDTGSGRDRAMTGSVGTGAAAVHALGSDPDESARLRRQSEELGPESRELLGRIGPRPGQSAIDLGCGPSGIIDLLSTGRPGWRRPVWWRTPAPTQPVIPAARYCPTWCAAWPRSSWNSAWPMSGSSPGSTGRSASISPIPAPW